MYMKETPLSKLKKDVAPYEGSDTKASLKQIGNTMIPFFLLWYASYLSLSVSYWLTVPLLLVTSGFLVRIFILFHDCCHQSFFRSRRANDVLGTITGILTLVPYMQWKHTHSVHHATSSNLDKRGVGDMWLLTVQEYAQASFWKKVAYRCYRHPLVMFGLGPISVFLIEYRFNRREARLKERLNVYLTNVGIVVLYTLLILAIGWKAFLLIQAPVFFLSGVMGIWLFYVQHQFEDSYFEHEEQWSYVQAAVEGSSYYKLPKVLQWITGNIGFHHVHHLSPKVPNYNLEKAHEAVEPLQKATTITIRTSLKALRYRLWDEERKVFLSFKEAKPYLKKAKSDAKEEVELLPGRRPSWQGE